MGMNQASSNRADLAPAKRRLFIVISVLLPLMVLAGIEVLLRWSGFGGYEPIFKEIGETPRGKLIVSHQAGAREFFFANPARPGFSAQYAFYSPKPADTVRIVLVGGSAIKGFPQTRRFAASAFLKEMLGDVWPERTVEVINLGTTAVASFPVRELLEQALEYEPDLVIVYSGHNEFYGAYGVASINQAGSTPRMLELQYQIRELAIMQALSRFMHYLGGARAPSLMEAMVGQDYVEADSWKREAASNLLYAHVGSMIAMCDQRDVPVLVCTLPTNERDLAPIGSDRAVDDQEAVIATAMSSYNEEPDRVIDELSSVLHQRPDHARAHFYIGKAYFVAGDTVQARHHFQRARDLDPMPWRATSALQQSIRRAAQEQGASLCDVEDEFRRHSPGGSIGRELMDDHVHPSLRGQALLARTIVESLTTRTDALSVSRERYDALPDWQVYTRRLGYNPYDHYAVAHTLRTLFSIPFMHASNPDGLRRFNKVALELESRMRPEVRDIVREWQKPESHIDGKQPVSGMVARELLRVGRNEEAMALFDVARHSVPAFSDSHLEYAYQWLALRKQLQNGLSEDDLALADHVIERAEHMLRLGLQTPGTTEKHLAALRRLRGQYD